MNHRPGFGQLLRSYRTSSGLTQERLAELSNLSVQAVNALEAGRRLHPRPATVAQLATALDLSTEDRERLMEAARRPRTGDLPSAGVPRQLPPPIGDFTGRSEHLDDLVDLLKNPDAASPGIVVSAIGGMGGIGKTTLAVQAAHLVADVYADGQLYLNLRGASADPVTSADALDTLLQALGLAPAAAADDLAATSARYRTALAGRRLLLMLDDAASVEQILPLMPGTSGVVVVVTSRFPLTTLPGARRVALGVLPEDEALELLAEVVGPGKVTDDPGAAIEVVRRCGLLPLAIRIAGGHAGTRPLAALATRLADADGKSDVLTGPNAEVRRSLSLSLDQLRSSGSRLDADAAAALPVLALFDGDHFPLRAAAAVLQRSVDDVEDLLERLVDIYLLESPAIQRYRMHDLVQEIGRTVASTRLTAPERREVRLRELACYASVVWRRDELSGAPEQYGSRSHRWAAGAEDLDDLAQVTAWLEAELPNLRRLIRSAAEDSDARLLAVRMALGLPTLAVSVMKFAEARSALTAVALLPVELPAEMEVGRLYATALMCGCLGLDEEGLDWLLRALPVARDRGGQEALARCLIDLGFCLGRLGRPEQGLPYAEEGWALAAAEEGSRFVSPGLLTVGVLAGQLGDLDRQRRAFDEVLRRIRPPVRGPDVVRRTMLARSLRETGQLEDAVEVLQQNIADVRELGLDVIETDVLVELGAAHLAVGDFEQALEVLDAGLRIASRYPAEHREAPLLKLFGEALAAVGKVDEAREMWQRAVVLYDREADTRAAQVRSLLAEA